MTAGEPLSDDTLAELHAGALDDATAARVRSSAHEDQRALDTLAALDATTADLAALGSAPGEEIPADVASRLDAALAAEASGTQPAEPERAPVVGIGQARRKRNRLLGWGTGAVAAAAAAVVAVSVTVPSHTSDGSATAAAPGPRHGVSAPTALALHSGELDSAISSVIGEHDLGPLHNEARLDACLRANDIDPDVKPAGVRPATIDGQRAVIVLYPTGEYAQYRLVALAADCGPDNPGMLKNTVIGRGSGDGG